MSSYLGICRKGCLSVYIFQNHGLRFIPSGVHQLNQCQTLRLGKPSSTFNNLSLSFNQVCKLLEMWHDFKTAESSEFPTQKCFQFKKKIGIYLFTYNLKFRVYSFECRRHFSIGKTSEGLKKNLLYMGNPYFNFFKNGTT